MNNIKEINELDNSMSPVVVSGTLKPSGVEVVPDEKWSCLELVRRYNDNQIEIQPDFQRNFVWSRDVQTQLIDSLVNEIPIPHLFLGLDKITKQYKVIDGLQRVSTIIRFFSDKKFKLSKSHGIDARISGKSVSEIKRKSEKLYKILENTMIHYTLIKCDFSDKSHMDYLFKFFNRINTGGKTLSNQEIRNCICKGDFNNLLKEIAKSPEWNTNIGKTPKLDRLLNEEMVLKIFAFVDKLEEYNGELSRFMDAYMAEKKDMGAEELAEKQNTFTSSLLLIQERINKPEKIQKFGRTVKEMLLVGIVSNIKTLGSKSEKEIQAMFKEFESFVNDEEFKRNNLGQGSSKKEKVKFRLSKAKTIFSK